MAKPRLTQATRLLYDATGQYPTTTLFHLATPGRLLTILIEARDRRPLSQFCLLFRPHQQIRFPLRPTVLRQEAAAPNSSAVGVCRSGAVAQKSSLTRPILTKAETPLLNCAFPPACIDSEAAFSHPSVYATRILRRLP